jgi:CheY-like chemotaxis protein
LLCVAASRALRVHGAAVDDRCRCALPLRERSAFTAPPSTTAAAAAESPAPTLSRPSEDEKVAPPETLSTTTPEPCSTPSSTQSYSRTLTLQLPIQSSTGSVPHRSALVASRELAPEPVVLIVDDVRSVRLLLRRALLALLGERAKVHEAADGREAVVKALKLRPGIIFMDRRMPTMEGDAATRELRRRGYTGVIFGLTGDALPVDVSAFRDAGATDVLIKPVTRMVLLTALRDCGALPQPVEEGSGDSGSRGVEHDSVLS